MAEKLKKGQLPLLVCRECATTIYPPQETCPECLSDDLKIDRQKREGTVMSGADVHASLEPWFKDQLPVNVAIVRLDDGPVVYAFSDQQALPMGTRVKVSLESVDGAGPALKAVETKK